MYLIEAFFRLTQAQNDLNAQRRALNRLIDQWRYNGQILGREIPLYLTEDEEGLGFAMRLICPEQTSLLSEHQNRFVNQAFEDCRALGLRLEQLELLGDELNSDATAPETAPTWQILYTTHLQSCSPLYHGDLFAPIPLYRALKNAPAIAKDVIKWQENWQAYDQLQMNAAALENAALAEIGELDSLTSKHGRALAEEITQATQIPTYYYLYRVGGTSKDAELNRSCPSCGSDWRLESPLVPGLELAMGAGDLLARGTSLLVIIPTAISGTWTNYRHGLVNLKISGIVGLTAAIVTPLGSTVAAMISPAVGATLFNIFLVCVSINMIVRSRKRG